MTPMEVWLLGSNAGSLAMEIYVRWLVIFLVVVKV